MVILSSLNEVNFQQLLTFLPTRIQIQKYKKFNREILQNTQPDLIFLEAIYFNDPTALKPFTSDLIPKVILWGCEDDDLKTVIPLVERGIHYYSFPVNADQISDLLLIKSMPSPAPDTTNEFADLGIVGYSKPICEVRKIIKKYSPFKDAITLLGETGTGKEITAKALHSYSGSSGPFVAVNCAAIPETLLESEMFGCVKGAYTDSVNKPGYFECAHGGTLFLDEIGEMSLMMQSKLLRILEDKQLTRLGSTKKISLDVRIISATSKDLKKLVSEGLFRIDLYYRLNVLIIQLPPLRSRKQDIPMLCNFLLQREKSSKMIHPDAMMKLLEYSWPGNVRELRSILRKADILSDKKNLILKNHIQYS
ncbi:two-component system response regulator [Oceanispirochaeta crateris]|uniref:Two-component system response regulator n=1 Tax=Oceanispirochaeta crateris TaxID=2518645 RepID=A0A5C1QR87_9SPIO|nr:sigma 54-interacting transcriptional regulator [Oceanispirochaeta crateris]QEN09086.1 two-component system response regulator [Oceanispirochaeta crateris]